jgi:hypothetical protein
VPASWALLRGAAGPLSKSFALLSLSRQPPLLRNAARVFDTAGVGPLPSKLVAVPKPTKSITLAVGMTPLSAVLLLDSAILPPLAPIGIVPVASGVGNAVVPPLPTASCTSRYWPGCNTKLSGSLVTCHALPVADAYCTLQPVRLTALSLMLRSSMKSFL